MIYEELESRIAHWAHQQDDVRAVVIIGSRARQDHPADKFSDLDLCIFTMNPDAYRVDNGWLAGFGKLWLAVYEPTGEGNPEWMALYEGGLKADLVFFQANPALSSLTEQIAHAPHQNVFRRGVRVLLNRYSGSAVIDLPAPRPEPATQEAFSHMTAEFLMNVTRLHKFTQRGDLWRAMTVNTCKMRAGLVQLMGWHAHCVLGSDDIWYDGRFMDEWADQQALQLLPDIFPHYEAQALRTALLTQLDVFHRLGTQTATQLGYSFPTEAYEHIRSMVQTDS